MTRTEPPAEEFLLLELHKSKNIFTIFLNDERIAGPSKWGETQHIESFMILKSELLKIINS